MADDWRITVNLPGEEKARELAERPHTLEVDPAMGAKLGGRIAVSRDEEATTSTPTTRPRPVRSR